MTQTVNTVAQSGHELSKPPPILPANHYHGAIILSLLRLQEITHRKHIEELPQTSTPCPQIIILSPFILLAASCPSFAL